MKLATLFEFVDEAAFRAIERFCDALWGKLGIDVKFTKHFLERLNDERNEKPISPAELIRLFKKEYQQHGKAVAELDAEAEAVFSDLLTHVNLPFVMKGEGEDRTMIAKTILRKAAFKTTSPTLPVR